MPSPDSYVGFYWEAVLLTPYNHHPTPPHYWRGICEPLLMSLDNVEIMSCGEKIILNTNIVKLVKLNISLLFLRNKFSQRSGLWKPKLHLLSSEDSRENVQPYYQLWWLWPGGWVGLGPWLRGSWCPAHGSILGPTTLPLLFSLPKKPSAAPFQPQICPCLKYHGGLWKYPGWLEASRATGCLNMNMENVVIWDKVVLGNKLECKRKPKE